jgi:hypothetical protein
VTQVSVALALVVAAVGIYGWCVLRAPILALLAGLLIGLLCLGPGDDPWANMLISSVILIGAWWVTRPSRPSLCRACGEELDLHRPLADRAPGGMS